MGEVVQGRFRAKKKFEPSLIGDLVVGRMLHGDQAGWWVALEIGAVDHDGAVAMVKDNGEMIAVHRIIENSAGAPHFVAPARDLQPGAVERLAGVAADDLDGLKAVFRKWKREDS